MFSGVFSLAQRNSLTNGFRNDMADKKIVPLKFDDDALVFCIANLQHLEIARFSYFRFHCCLLIIPNIL